MKRILAAGTPRSGTTLLQQILMAHPDGISIPETHFFNEIDEDVLFSGSTSSRDKWNHVKSQNHARIISNILSPDELEDTIEQSRGMIDLFINILDFHAERKAVSFWVEKTPTHLGRFPHLFQDRKPLNGVLISRNPLDTCASLVEKPWAADDIEENAKRWLADNTLNTLLVEACPDDITLVRYEDLVTNPEEEIRRTCDFLNIDFDEDMLRPEEYAQDVTFDWEEWKDHNYRPINDSAVGKHKVTLSDSQIQTVKTITAPLSNRLHDTDYPVTPFWEETYRELKAHYTDTVSPLRE